ncbi:MAG: NRDE family protein [Cytophagales bacterium]|nr:NRDE family protein [Cytophagales bacterium]
MCTVTYLPQEDNQYILTSNRDEVSVRKTTFPHIYPFDNYSLLGPQDTKAGGTWIATSNQNMTVCLLNGAFQKHIPKPPYRQSRGQIVLDAFKFGTAQEFIENYSFEGTENFTLVLVYNQKGKEALHELRWDGEKLYHAILDRNKAYIWASSTLYSNEIVTQRKEWFAEFIETKEATLENIRNFHQFGGNGDQQNGLQISRDNSLQTVSITSVVSSEQSSEVHYLDRLNDSLHQETIQYL